MKANKTVIINKFPYKKELKSVINEDINQEDLKVIKDSVEAFGMRLSY